MKKINWEKMDKVVEIGQFVTAGLYLVMVLGIAVAGIIALI